MRNMCNIYFEYHFISHFKINKIDKYNLSVV